MHDKLIFYIDGASQGNPGPAGIGIIVCDEDDNVLQNICEYIGENTNNVAEYTAFIYALQEALIRKAASVVVNTDSELLVKQLNGEYKIKDEKIRQLFNQAKHLLKGFNIVDVNYINRSKNKGADKLATEAVDNAVKPNQTQKVAKFSFRNLPRQAIG